MLLVRRSAPAFLRPVLLVTAVVVVITSVSSAAATPKPKALPDHAKLARGGLGAAGSIACATPRACLAAGGYTLYGASSGNGAHAYTWSFSGSRWSGPRPVPGGELAFVACPKVNRCVGVGSTGNQGAGVGQTWNGRVWTQPEQIADQAPTGLSCTSASFCLAVTASGEAVSFDGKAWSKSVPFDHLAQAAVTEFSCSAAGRCVAVDGAHGKTFVLRGARWTAHAGAPALAAQKALACASASFCVSVGAGQAATFNGSKWSRPVDLGGRRGTSAVLDASAVSCPTAHVCIAGGSNEAEVKSNIVYGEAVSVFKGGRWSVPVQVETSPADLGPFLLACPSSSFCAGTDGHNVFWGRP